jgi:hypothetical protein
VEAHTDAIAGIPPPSGEGVPNKLYDFILKIVDLFASLKDWSFSRFSCRFAFIRTRFTCRWLLFKFGLLADKLLFELGLLADMFLFKLGLLADMLLLPCLARFCLPEKITTMCMYYIEEGSWHCVSGRGGIHRLQIFFRYSTLASNRTDEWTAI